MPSSSVSLSLMNFIVWSLSLISTELCFLEILFYLFLKIFLIFLGFFFGLFLWWELGEKFVLKYFLAFDFMWISLNVKGLPYYSIQGSICSNGYKEILNGLRRLISGGTSFFGSLFFFRFLTLSPIPHSFLHLHLSFL